MKKLAPALLFCFAMALTSLAQQSLVPTQGMTIRQSVIFKKDTFWLAAADSLTPALRIEGDGITVDFNGAVINGGRGKSLPDQFSGTGIVIKGRNITLKNAVLRGFKVAIFAEGVDSLRLLDSDLSYNWRPRLHSIREREDFSDWLSFHQNDKDEWLRYGAGIYLKNCSNVLVKGCTVTQGMNGLLMTGCNDGLFYNNSFHFNSGLGIGMYRSSRNRVMHNRLDFNVRGYSHGFYQRGQDSAGILVYEQCNENTFAYNSATHSGDGFFLWAGQTTMDPGEGGCNDNLIYSNDFSYAPTNGIEVTFSRNKIIQNLMEECTYGIWGGYSYESLVLANRINSCRYGIAIEHGQDNSIINNFFMADTIGVQLWARPTQPADWGYAKNRDVSSREYQIGRNSFMVVSIPLKISASKKVVVNDGNGFAMFDKLLVVEKPNEDFELANNEVMGDGDWHDAADFMDLNGIARSITRMVPFEEIKQYAVDELPDGIMAMLPLSHPRGRKNIMMNEWGPYNFEFPFVFFDTIENGIKYVFTPYGPLEGRWDLVNSYGFQTYEANKKNRFMNKIELQKLPNATDLLLEFEYTGPAFTDQFGNYHPADVPYRFTFRRFEKKLDWKISWHDYNEATDPLTHYADFKKLKTALPIATKTTDDLYFAWWGKPAEGVAEDKFATFAEAEFDMDPGDYAIELTSDDGARLFLDGKLLIDRWNVHEPATDEVRVRLGGHHKIEVEHFDGGGFATLDFKWRKLGD
ncbi:MAG: right-handed parallel beta-helix repeat-containing protein [Saprospiraceae bacterium]|nr:right-handed parallel beta-helix repeat-containing protein [Saprospiraceae bacterium]